MTSGIGGDPDKGWSPPSVDDAAARAAELIGADWLESAMNDPWIETYMNTVLQLFSRTSAGGRSAVPRFIYRNNWLVPEADDAPGLTSLIKTLID